MLVTGTMTGVGTVATEVEVVELEVVAAPAEVVEVDVADDVVTGLGLFVFLVQPGG